MADRSYRQFCPVARALEVVGGRWTLLIIRELFDGPKRFKDLLNALGGIGTNLLSARLRELEGRGVVVRGVLPPPAGSAVYQLGRTGHRLRPALEALADFGADYLLPMRGGDRFRAAWTLWGIRAVFRPEAARGIREVYEFRVGEEVFHVRVDDGAVDAQMGAASSPAVIVSGDFRTLVALAAGEISAQDADIKLAGDADALDRCVKMFPLRAAPGHDPTPP